MRKQDKLLIRWCSLIGIVMSAISMNSYVSDSGNPVWLKYFGAILLMISSHLYVYID